MARERKPVPMPTVRPGRRAAKIMPSGPKKKSSGATAPLKAQKPKKSSNMQSFYNTKDKVEMAKYQATGATHQIKINKAKGKLDNLDYVASKTPAQRTKDLNRLNDTSKTLGRAKNIESKAAKAKAKPKSRDYIRGYIKPAPKKGK
jgi:hypothetical protein